MESLYGGRRGASIIIVKHFDGIDIPQIEGSYVYKIKYYATNENNELILDDFSRFIEKTGQNYIDYNWKQVILDGSEITAKDIEGNEVIKILPRSLAEGMRQCFEQGASTTDEVNYGESVIIDTVSGLGQDANPDNGKVFRRGLKFQYDAATNPYAGGEYIGQIVGPPGRSFDLGMDIVNNIKENSGYSLREYDQTNGGMVPGKDGDNYNDKITYSWVQVRDDIGNLNKYLFGFTFPYLVEEFEAESVSPYYNRSNDTEDFVNENLIEKQDDGTHPYYKKWGFKIPKGIKGDSSTSLELYPTYVRPGTEYWTSSSLDGAPAGELPSEGAFPIVEYDNRQNFLKVQKDVDTFVYCKKDAGWKKKVRYIETNYDRIAEGNSRYKDIGDYNSIADLKILPNGDLFVNYTYNDGENLGRVRGVMAGLNILGNYDSIDELYRIENNDSEQEPEEPGQSEEPETTGDEPESNEEHNSGEENNENPEQTGDDPENSGQNNENPGSEENDPEQPNNTSEPRRIAIPPENLTDPANDYHSGWCVTVGGSEIYAYDYNKQDWYSIGNIAQALIDAGVSEGAPCRVIKVVNYTEEIDGETVKGVKAVLGWIDENGNQKTTEDYDLIDGSTIKSIKVRNGKRGQKGKSAYEVAVDEGYEGDVTQWLASLIGATGPRGDIGETGPKGDTGETGPAGRGITNLRVETDFYGINNLYVTYTDSDTEFKAGTIQVNVTDHIATYYTPGVVMPDGNTIGIDDYGRIYVISNPNSGSGSSGGGSGGGSHPYHPGSEQDPDAEAGDPTEGQFKTSSNITMTVCLDFSDPNPDSWGTWVDNPGLTEIRTQGKGVNEVDAFMGYYPVTIDAEGNEIDLVDFHDFEVDQNGNLLSAPDLTMIKFPAGNRGFNIWWDPYDDNKLYVSITNEPGKPGYYYFRYKRKQVNAFYLGAYLSPIGQGSGSDSEANPFLSKFNNQYYPGFYREYTNPLRALRQYYNNNENFAMFSWLQFVYLQCCAIIKYKGKLLKDMLGYASMSSSPKYRTGQLSQKGLNYGTQIESNNIGIKLFGLEHFYGGNIDQILCGISGHYPVKVTEDNFLVTDGSSGYDLLYQSGTTNDSSWINFPSGLSPKMGFLPSDVREKWMGGSQTSKLGIRVSTGNWSDDGGLGISSYYGSLYIHGYDSVHSYRISYWKTKSTL